MGRMDSTAVESMDMRVPADVGVRGDASSAQSQRAVGDSRRGQDGSFTVQSLQRYSVDITRCNR